MVIFHSDVAGLPGKVDFLMIIIHQGIPWEPNHAPPAAPRKVFLEAPEDLSAEDVASHLDAFEICGYFFLDKRPVNCHMAIWCIHISYTHIHISYTHTYIYIYICANVCI